MKFLETNQIKLDNLKKPKKLTGTRFATVLGLNAWATPFQVWCEITKTYQPPFEDTIYTIAGKVIEPKIIEYLKRVYMMDIQCPEDVYGQDVFKKTFGDFYPEQPIFGGMWDAIGDDFIVEIKTTKRAEDWQNEIPMYYKLQAALYAYLKGFDDVFVTASFLEDKDYENPELFEPSVHNTIVYQFKISEEFADFENDYIQPALAFWEQHVDGGESPVFDEKKDAEYLKALRTNTVAPTEAEILKLLIEADKLKLAVDKNSERIKEKADALKKIEAQLKKFMGEQFADGFNAVELPSRKYLWQLSRSTSEKFDEAKFAKDHPDLHAQYLKQVTTTRLNKKAIAPKTK